MSGVRGKPRSSVTTVFRKAEQEVPGRASEQLAALLNNLGTLQMRQGRYPESLARYGEALAIYQMLSNSAVGKFTADVAMVEANLGAVLWTVNRWADARSSLPSTGWNRWPKRRPAGFMRSGCEQSTIWVPFSGHSASLKWLAKASRQCLRLGVRKPETAVTLFLNQLPVD